MQVYKKRAVYVVLIILFFSLFVSAAIIPTICKELWYVTLILAVGAAIDAGLFLLPFYKLISDENKIRKKLEIYAFTDRETELGAVCEILKQWAEEYLTKPICILCDTNATGRTYFLLKIWHTVISKSDFNKNLKSGKINYKTWRKIKKIVYIDCLDNSEETKKLIDKINYRTHKKNHIYIFDNLNDNIYDTVIKKFNLMKFIYSCDSTSKEIKDLNCEPVSLSRFQKNDVMLYHKKINNFGLNLKPENFNKIMDFTQGNIKQISKIFDTRKNINAFLALETSNDEFKKILTDVEFKLLIGDYGDALVELDKNKEKFLNTYIKYLFNYRLLRANCLHLLNRYEDAILELSILMNNFLQTENFEDVEIDEVYKSFNKDHIVDIRLAHYEKHMGNFVNALHLLEKIKTVQAKLDMLGIYAADYFLNEQSYSEFINTYEELQGKIKSMSEEQLNKFYRYSPVYFYLKEGKIFHNDLDKCINYYEKTKDHLIANALFMKAELFRLNNSLKNATKLYQQCLEYAYSFKDENLKLQVSLMINYLITTRKIKFNQKENTPNLSIVQIKNIALKYKMDYNYNCACYFNSVNLSDTEWRSKTKKIDHRIFIIL